MGQVCRQICGEAVEPPNDSCRRGVITLQVFAACQLLIMISAFVIADVSNGIFSIIFIFLLFCAWRFLQYSIVTFYIFFSILMFVFALVYLLTIVQNGRNGFPGGMATVATSFQIVYCVYYFMAAIIAFYIYREFKAAAFEKNPAIAGYFQQRNNAVGDANEPQSYAEDNNFAPNYGDQQHQNRPQPRGNNRQMFEVFQGKGIKVGDM